MYIDFHTHKPIHTSQKNTLEVVSAHDKIKYDNTYFTIGYHPWWTEALLTQEQLQNIEKLLQNQYCLGIGECGLDKLKGADKSIQEAVFIQHILMANKFNTPLIIHCVRQYDQVIGLRKKYGNTPWVIHGYRRNHLLAKSLIDQGIMLSVAPFEGMNQGFLDCLTYLPMNSFFIETDSDYTLSIIQRYAIMEELKKINTFDLQNQMVENFTTFFKWKQINLIGSNERNSL